MLGYLAIGIAAGIISGMGIGGGTVLIPALVILYGMEQQAAQNINLIYFIPTALAALFIHIKKKNIKSEIILKLVLFGLIGAVCGSLLANVIKTDILRRIFGVFMLSVGVFEFFACSKDKKQS